MKFLRRIENASFPLAIHDESDIRRAALAAVQLIEANLPTPGASNGVGGIVILIRITLTVRAELKRLHADGAVKADPTARRSDRRKR